MVDDTQELIARMRRVGADLHDVEVKAAAGGLPGTVIETLSSFANGAGGVLILGLAESAGFEAVAGFDPHAMRDAVAGVCADKLTPPLRAPVELVEVDDGVVVRVDVPELDPVEKPCFITARGAYQGSYIRGGDGDRKLGHYEVSMLLSNRHQPQHDREVVPGATRKDLDDEFVSRLLTRARGRSARAFPHSMTDEAVLTRLGVLGDDDGVLRPTVAGLLSVGVYPQEFFPQLFISFVAMPTPEPGRRGPDGRRFLDNDTIDGPIPILLEDAAAAVRRNMRVGAVIEGLGRRDVYDYPLDAIRELIVNAIMHRDYSPDSRGTQIQIELYPDRLVVRSPGGLHGSALADSLGTEEQQSSSRNATLAKLLADVPVASNAAEGICENRGTGLPAVISALRDAGMSPPDFDSKPAQMIVTVPQHALLSPETVEWIGSLRQSGLTNAQHLAIAMMKNVGRSSSSMLRAWGVGPQQAGQALRDLVDRGVAVRSGGKRYATYQLGSDTPSLFGDEQWGKPASGDGIAAENEAIIQAIQAGFVTARELSERLDMTQRTLARRLDGLIEQSVVQRTRPKRSSRQSYRITTAEETS